MISKEMLIAELPKFNNRWTTVTHNQDVPDIIHTVLEGHNENRAYYDKIYKYFDTGNLENTCNTLYWFCKENIVYKEEPEETQTVSIPTGILIRGYGDCKHYAGFCAGVLGAMRRATGNPAKIEYCFASYKLDEQTPYHVYTIATDESGQEYWIDPTPGANGKTPVWWLRKSAK